MNWRTIGVLVLLWASPALAGDFYVYPAHDQSAQQQDKDDHECQQWATGQSGFDPTDAPHNTSNASQPSGQVVKGALLGALIGGIAGDAGEGAAWGAGVGVLSKANSNHKAANQQQAAQNQYAQQRGSFNNAYSACMGGRGYTLTSK